MSLYYLSSFNTISHSGNKSIYRNSVTGMVAFFDSSTLSLLEDTLCAQQITELEQDRNLLIFQIISLELLSRGIIVPVDQKEREEEYLESLVLIKQTGSTYFNATSLSELKLSLLDHDEKNLIFCGVPSDFGATNPGTRFGPALIRDKSSACLFRSSKKKPCLLDIIGGCEVFSSCDLVLYDAGDVNVGFPSCEVLLERVRSSSALIASKGIPFFIGGDHLFTLPIVKGVYQARKKPFTFVQFDYHLDIQCWGEFKDNKPKVLTRPTHANFVSWIHREMPSLKILQIGIDNYQSLDKNQFRSIQNYFNTVGDRISNLEFCLNSMQSICDKLPKDEDVYISIDVDVLNGLYMKATGYPSSTGISVEHLLLVLANLCKRNRIIGVDIMEFGQNSDLKYHSSMSTIIVNVMLELLKNIQHKRV